MDKPLLHLVFGGEVEDPQGMDFIDPDGLDVVGIFPSNDAAAFSASAPEDTILIPPALPRPPAWTWALTTELLPRPSAI